MIPTFYGLNCVPPPKIHVEVLIPNTCECDFILIWELCRCNYENKDEVILQ